MAASTARACLRRLSDWVNSARSDHAAARSSISACESGTTTVTARALLRPGRGAPGPPLVDGLFREQPLPVLLEGRDATLHGQALEGGGVHGEIGRGFGHRHRVFGNHVREVSLSACLSDSISASRAWMRSTICSRVRARGSGRSLWFRSMPDLAPSRHVTRPGTPTTTELSGPSRTTTDPAPIRLPLPMRNPPMILAPAPTTTLSPRVGWRFSRLVLVPPSVTPCRIETFSPTSAVSPMTTPMPWSMKSPGPSTAAGWISTPVMKRPTWEMKRARVCHPALQRGWARRWNQMACTPGQQSTTSSDDRAAGSRSSTVRMSRRICSNMEISSLTPPVPGQGISCCRAQGPRDHERRMPPLRRQPSHSRLDSRRGHRGEILKREARGDLGARAACRQRGPASVGLEPRLLHPAVPHPQVEARQVHALRELLLAHPVGLPHDARVPRVAEVIDEGRTVLH